MLITAFITRVHVRGFHGFHEVDPVSHRTLSLDSHIFQRLFIA